MEDMHLKEEREELSNKTTRLIGKISSLRQDLREAIKMAGEINDRTELESDMDNYVSCKDAQLDLALTAGDLKEILDGRKEGKL